MASYVMNLLNRTSKYNSLINRKAIKQACMTTLYGASPGTSTQNILSAIIDQSIDKGIMSTFAEEQDLRKLAAIMCKLLLTWLKKSHPEASLLYKIIRHSCKNKSFIPPLVISEYSSWYYFPKEATSYTKTIFNKDYKLHKYTEKIDYKTLSSAFVANYIQFIDGIIANKIIRKMAALGIPIISVHDCWYVPIEFIPILKEQLRICYQEVLEADYLTVHFAKDNPNLLIVIEKARESGLFGPPLTAADLNNPKFVKR